MADTLARPEIRRATVDDAGELARYMTAIMAENLDTIPQRGPMSEERQRELIEKAECGGRSFFMLAVHRDRIVGMADIRVGESRHDEHASQLGISIAKEWRGRGLGRELMNATVAAARAVPGLCRIELECVTWNIGAIELYRSLGFEIEALKRKSVNFRGQPEDEYLMALVW